MNYSVLLTRSTDFDLYSRIYYPAYPDEGDQLLGLTLIQLLWDRGEANGWAASATTRPPPNSPPHVALIHATQGDEEVASWTADALARTAGASIRRPAVALGRTRELNPFGLPPIGGFPFTGSALVYWDAGPSWNGVTPAAQLQKSEFLKRGGAIVDTCPAGQPCAATQTETS
jgi:hypothetical protein